MPKERCCRKWASTYSALLTFLLALSILPAALKAQESNEPKSQERSNGLNYFAAGSALYDDNLFRQPAESSLLSGFNHLHRQDLIARVSAGLQGSWALARQTFELKAQGDENRYQYNDNLSYISGSGMLTWNWSVGSRWSGRLGADYARALADFANNNQVLDKDLVTQRGSFAAADYQVGPRWILRADLRWSSALHSAAVRKVDDGNIRTQKFGVEFKLSPTDAVGWDYRHSNANFSGDLLVNGKNFNRNYDESASIAWLKYALGGKTDLDCEAGYVRRNYPNATIGNFTGATGRATLDWHVSAKTDIAITGWRDLTAYIDAQSNYFVTRGAKITPSWTPTAKITTSVVVSWERQNYIGSDPNLALDPLRHDIVKSVQANATYLPARALEVDVSYRRELRDSNQTYLSYTDNVAILSLRLLLLALRGLE